ncbi:hypothetical protein CR513_00465, partial [Mucuna pruriens]
MDLELGLKITKTRDDIASISEYRLAKDKAGPVFQTRETNTMFILIAHLKALTSRLVKMVERYQLVERSQFRIF